MLGRYLRDRANDKNGSVDSGADLVTAIILLYYGFEKVIAHSILTLAHSSFFDVKKRARVSYDFTS